jgi:hypothetical protein
MHAQGQEQPETKLPLLVGLKFDLFQGGFEKALQHLCLHL